MKKITLFDSSNVIIGGISYMPKILKNRSKKYIIDNTTKLLEFDITTIYTHLALIELLDCNEFKCKFNVYAYVEPKFITYFNLVRV